MGLLSPMLTWSLANPRWASILNPIISLPILQGTMITDIVMIANTKNVINHTLQRQPQGWFLSDNTASCTVWRTAWNTLTITLESSANSTIAIWVF